MFGFRCNCEYQNENPSRRLVRQDDRLPRGASPAPDTKTILEKDCVKLGLTMVQDKRLADVLIEIDRPFSLVCILSW